LNENLSFAAFYPHPPERVWQALTDPAALGRWLLPTDFQPRIGFRFQFAGGVEGGKRPIRGVVLEAEAARRLRYTWDEDGEAGTPSVVTWMLEPQAGGTRVRLEHQVGTAAAVSEGDRPYVLIEANANWRYAMHASLPLLLRLLAADSHRPPTPIVYVQEEPEAAPKRRAGFRKEEASCPL
jgi:uncharacterized protein YndB with AHSA1/START domain